MKCPQCDKEIQIPYHARKNMDSYGNAVTVSVDCCNKAVRIIPRVYYETVKVVGVEVDDWGDECK